MQIADKRVYEEKKIRDKVIKRCLKRKEERDNKRVDKKEKIKNVEQVKNTTGN